MTIFPRSWAFDDSDCQVGTVLVFIPLPTPVMIRPTMRCGRLYEVHCSSAPMVMVIHPQKIVLRRPRGFPMKIVKIAPKKQPKL